MGIPDQWLAGADAAVAALLLPLTVWIIVSGIDDIFVDLAGLFAALRNRSRPRPTRRELLCRPWRGRRNALRTTMRSAAVAPQYAQMDGHATALGDRRTDRRARPGGAPRRDTS